jgi:hypothetical protein
VRGSQVEGGDEPSHQASYRGVHPPLGGLTLPLVRPDQAFDYLDLKPLRRTAFPADLLFAFYHVPLTGV